MEEVERGVWYNSGSGETLNPVVIFRDRALGV